MHGINLLMVQMDLVIRCSLYYTLMYSTVIIDFTLCLDFYFVKFDIQDIIEGVSFLFINDFGLNQFSSPGEHR